MNPISKKIINKLSQEDKTELKSEKVELAILDNLKKYASGLNKYQNEGDGLVKRADRLKTELDETQKAIYKWSDVGESIANDIVKDLSKFEKSAKELGISPGSVKEYINAEKAFKEFSKLEQKYQKIAKEL
jgi:SMC interacting uncharacterized protein involved in chromosome segregation